MSLSSIIQIMLSSHQDFIKTLVGAVNTSPLCIEIPVVGSQWAGSYHFVTERNHAIEIGILLVLGSPGSTTLRLTVKQSLCQEMSSRVLCPGSVTTPFLGRQQIIGSLKIFNYQIQSFLLSGTCVVLFDCSVGRFSLQSHSTILTEQTVVIVSTQEVSLTKSLVTGIFIGNIVSLADNQVGSRDSVVHLIPES